MAAQPADGNASNSRYMVVARRYRPQSFADLVGQQSAARALGNAIATQRIGHAYLFTGARGVGKTSTARIFAKALNCVQGPTAEPCQSCEMCCGIADGNDVDVLEIDGASNRGIDEIRQLRSSIGVRPSRSRFKVYIIDEVHMLTREAFNALLKTLEEPPAHVKFIFCTTSPEKIPITVLSRCQRFDFPPVELTQIIGRLAEIVAQEGATAEAAALELLAKRAAGSMRDSQSLLEQVLAFCGNQVTSAAVHQMMGTASSQRLLDMLDFLTKRDAAGILSALDMAIHEGVDAGQLAEQLLGYLRDTLALAVGGQVELLLHSSQQDVARLRDLAQSWGIESLLAAAQIIDQSIVRMRQSLHGRTLLELALVRVARLEQLDCLPELLQRLHTLQDARPSARPANTPASVANQATVQTNQAMARSTSISPPALAPQAEAQKKNDSSPEPLKSNDGSRHDDSPPIESPPTVSDTESDWNPSVAARAWQ
ncbi:MAG: DNA polymerase III subunit gamma/tau, partial [Planctomycetota bacterium]|nr:DNA polymerase III subunit gamma/tau [Planctomycetota bacterium]